MTTASELLSNGEGSIWWNYAGSSADCLFKVYNSGEILARITATGSLLVSENVLAGINVKAPILETSLGIINVGNPPLWISATGSSSSSIAEFRLNSVSKFKIKSDGVIEFLQTPAIESQNSLQIKNISSNSTHIASFSKNGSETFLVKNDGSVELKTSSSLLTLSPTSLATGQAFSVSSTHPITIENTYGDSSPISVFKKASIEKVRVEETGAVSFQENVLLLDADESVFESFSSDTGTVFIGKGKSQTPSKRWSVFVGRGAGTRTNPDSILAIWPEDNGGMLSLNKGGLDVGLKGYVGISAKKHIWMHTYEDEPNFKFIRTTHDHLEDTNNAAQSHGEGGYVGRTNVRRGSLFVFVL